ncbi:hypothetical protein [Bifidobacterium sp.]|jgi:hypothetical protein|uniref:hypothetical protein n=1 Tax=Bifidobacterium sp. TaxID=41200 RepID=UPI0025BE6D21|nr:hypothetical protein [Bifidobacterium sp.]MCH4210054.1 hypothetical protein [Bifidobacterium sp.]
MPTWNEISMKDGIYVGRNELPDALMMAVIDGELTDLDEIAKGLFDAWQGAEFPSRIWHKRDWLHLFHQVGYLDDDKRTTQPTTLPPVLYRASPARYRDNLSWTDDLKQAEWFNDRNNDYFSLKQKSKLWTIHPKASQVLARFGGGRGEGEWVVDVEKSDVSEYKTKQGTPCRLNIHRFPSTKQQA